MITYKNQEILPTSSPNLVKSYIMDEARKEWPDIDKWAHFHRFMSNAVAASHDYVQKLPIGMKGPEDQEKIKEKIAQIVKDTAVAEYGFWAKAGVFVLAVLFWPVTLYIAIAWVICKVFNIHFGT